MPRIQISDPFGTSYRIDTRNLDIVKAWFDDLLPHTFVQGRPDIDNFKFIWPLINVWPAFYGSSIAEEPDWLTYSPLICQNYIFPAKNGEEGIKALKTLRRLLTAEIPEDGKKVKWENIAVILNQHKAI